jgi:hypothetical protein
MDFTRETTHARWHSRAGFLATTLFVLAVIGAPFMVTRGLLQHGALFLPVTLVLLLVLGGPLTRLALATGQMGQRFPGRAAIHGLQVLVRVVLIGVLLTMSYWAAGWLYAETWMGVPDGALDFRTRELTAASTAWHLALTPSNIAAAITVAVLVLGLWGLARQRRLAGLSWIAALMLPVLGLLLTLGLVVGLSLSGAGALAALAAPVRAEALGDLRFWSDAVAIVLIGLGAQAGVVSAAGRGLPKRANIGREARIITAGVSLLLVLGGLAGLLLLCAYSVHLGIVPSPEHATPSVLVLELIPALGPALFPGWPPELQPSERQVTLAWTFLVTLCGALGATALLASRRWAPLRWKSGGAVLGYLAAVAALGGIAGAALLGVEDAWFPVMTVLPALLAIMHITLARRTGAGMRVISAAFAGEAPRTERLMLMLTFMVVRPLLLLAVLALALSAPEYGVVLGAFAVAFALMWVGSLGATPRSRETGMLASKSAAAVLLLAAAGSVYADAPEEPEAGQPRTRAMLAFAALSRADDVNARRKLVREFESEVMRAKDASEVADLDEITEWVSKLLEVAQEEPRPDVERARAVAEARAALACRMLLEPGDNFAVQAERAVLTMDGLAPFSRLDEAIAAFSAGQPVPLIELLEEVQIRIEGEALARALEYDPTPELAHLLAALIVDMRAAYGAAGPSARELRRYLLQRATQGRTLLKPDLGPGLAYLLSLLLAGALLATSLLFGGSQAAEE